MKFLKNRVSIQRLPIQSNETVNMSDYIYMFSFLAHSRWKQWMRNFGEANDDRSCRPWTEVVFRRRKLHCGLWTEVVSYASPPHLVKVKFNFDEAQKLMFKEIKCLYGLIKIITSYNISEAEMFTPWGPVAGSFQHKLRSRRRASEATILVGHAFTSVFS